MKLFTIKVYRWLSDKNKKLYIFNTDKLFVSEDKDAIIINENIYPDDNIEDAINKIALYIQNTDKSVAMPYYSWNSSLSLLFNPEIKWGGYNINPFKSTNRDSHELKEGISYDYKNRNSLFNYKIINIVFNSDIPKELKNNKYYFINSKILPYKTYKKRDDKLNFLKNVNNVYSKVVGESYTRIDFTYKLKSSILLVDLFDKMTTSKYIDMIMWVNDTSKILYKLNKLHRITREQLINWTNVEKIIKNKSIHIYSVIAKSCYAKISIEEDTGNILFTYSLDVRKTIKWNDIIKHKLHIIKILENIVKEPIKTSELSLNLNARIEMPNSSFPILVKKIGEYIDIFHVVKIINEKNKSKVICTYKRSTYYSNNIDISDYIKSRYNIGVAKDEIILELQNLGINDNVEKIVEEEIEMLNNNDIKNINRNININENGTIVVLESYAQGYNISIVNCANKKELEYLLFWLNNIISLSPSTEKKKHKIPTPPPQKSPSPQSSSKSSSLDMGKASFDLDSDNSLGGAPIEKKVVKKTAKQTYFINLLNQADKELFGENYARDKCQNPFQPIVLNKTEKEELEKNNNLHFDNIIEYGSNENINNYYACPRVWCPISKIPLDPTLTEYKCPKPDEEPMLLFWDKDKTKKRYVKLIKPNEKGIYAPCCMKKEPKQTDISNCRKHLKEPIKEDNKNTHEKNNNKQIINKKDDKGIKNIIEDNEPSIQTLLKDENYIMNQNAPIPMGRYGNIPDFLNKVLFENKIPTDICTKMLNKGQGCYVRKGIIHRANNISNNDSIMHCIAFLLNFRNKKELIIDIKKRLDIITFISLENGEVCKSFMSVNPIIIDDKILLKQFNKFYSNSSSTKIEYDINNDESISRMLNIYSAYKKFINYLENDNSNDKNVFYMFSLIKLLYEIIIVLWERKDKTDDISLICPYYSSYKDMIETDLNPSIGMVIKDGKYYEPIELKLRNSEGERLFKLNDYNLLKTTIEECNKYNKNTQLSEQIYKTLYSYNNWVYSKILKNYNNFKINKVFINDDLTIDKIMLKNNILLSIDKISVSLLPALLRDVERSTDKNDVGIYFYNDFINKTFNITINKKDLQLFASKCEILNIKYDLGKVRENINNDIATDYYTIITLTDMSQYNNDIIHYNKKGDYYNILEKENDKSKIWYKLQKYVADVIINKVDLEELEDLSRLERLEYLIKYFSNIQKDRKKIQIILEEIPLSSIKEIKEWINNIILYYKYDYFDSNIRETKKEFIFANNVFINNGNRVVPSVLIKYNSTNPNKIKDINIDNSDIKDFVPIASDVTNEIESPSLFNGKPEKLSTKWNMHKKSKWVNMVLIKNDKYNKNTIKEFAEWLSKKVGLNITYDDVLNSTNKKYINSMNNDKTMTTLLEDPSYFNLILEKFNKKFPTVQTFLTYYNTVTDDIKRKNILSIINGDKLYPNDLNILSIAELLNISILIIHRGKYGKFNEGDISRGEVSDLVLSSTFFPAKINRNIRPLIILQRNNNKTNYVYNIVMDKNNIKDIYMKYEDVPDNIKILTEAHIETQ